jgi:hypothetical protein
MTLNFRARLAGVVHVYGAEGRDEPGRLYTRGAALSLLCTPFVWVCGPSTLHTPTIM